MGDVEEASPEQKINIGTYFIMSAPVGEVDDVNADVSKLIGDSSVWSEEVQRKILRDYNIENLTTAPDSDGNPVLVSSFGQVDDVSYLDPNTGRVLEFDHKKRAWTKATDKKQVLPDEIAAYRDAVAKGVSRYLEEHYKKDKVGCAVYGNENGTLTICISAKNVHLSAYWTGAWKSVYTVSVKSKGDAEMKAALKVQVHYFEDGNVQLHSVNDKALKVKIADPDATAKDVATAISNHETEFQGNLEEMYVEMHRSTFKAMRRFLPISRNPMTWNLNAHNLAGEINK